VALGEGSRAALGAFEYMMRTPIAAPASTAAAA
jgi:alkyl hydroperoxide reductase subunit AhpF